MTLDLRRCLAAGLFHEHCFLLDRTQWTHRMLRLKVVLADVDVDALIGVLQILCDRNAHPQKISTHRLVLRSQRDREVVHIEAEFDDSDVTIEALRLIAAKIAQMPITLSTVFGQDAAQPGRAKIQTLVIPTIR